MAKHEQKYGAFLQDSQDSGEYKFDLGSSTHYAAVTISHRDGKTYLSYRFRLRNDVIAFKESTQSVIVPLMQEYLTQKESTVDSGDDVEI